jgi:uncharacterized protein with NAD-binding domain and iron-sulfur cluster
VASLLAESFRALASEMPEPSARMGQLLRGLSVALEVDGERFAADFSAEPRVRSCSGEEPVRMATTRAAILELLDGRRSLSDAVLEDAVSVVGPLDSLLRLHEGLRVYLHAAVRSPGFAVLLKRLRAVRPPDEPSPPQHQGAGVSHPNEPVAAPIPKQPPKNEQNEKGEPPRVKVFVFGGGVAGLTTAHELVIRGFDVHVYERERATGPQGLIEPLTVGGMARTQYFPLQLEPREEKRTCYFKTESSRASALSRELSELLRSGLKAIIEFAPGPGMGPRGTTYFPEFWFEFTREKENGPLKLTKDSEVELNKAIDNLTSLYSDSPQDFADLAKETSRSKILVQSFVDAPSAKMTQTVTATSAASAKPTPADDLGDAMVEILNKRLERTPLAGHVQRYPLPGEDSDPLVAYTAPGLPPVARSWVRVIIYTPMLPGEHGYRFFPSFYRHVFDTMRRTPLYDASGQPTRGTVYDNLIPLPRIGILSERNAPFVASWEPMQLSNTIARVEGGLRNLRGMDVPIKDVAQFSLRVLRYLTTCPARRALEMESVSWWDYLKGHDAKTGKSLYQYSESFTHLVTSSSRVMVALDGERGDARTCGNTFVQLLAEALVVTPKNNSTLNGPTSEAWFYHWRRHLEVLGVKFERGELDRLELGKEGQLIAHVVEPDGTDGTEKKTLASHGQDKGEALYFVVATDVLAAQKVTAGLNASHGVPAQLRRYVSMAPRQAGDPGSLERNPQTEAGREKWDRLQMISGIQYFFRKHVRLCEGYVYCVDSDWRLSAISSQNVWQSLPIDRLASYQSLISVDIGEWRGKSRRLGKTAWECTPAELAKEVFDQLRDSLRASASGQPTEEFDLPDYDYVHIDDELEFKGANLPLASNKTPYLVPIAGDWQHRPGADPWNPAPQSANAAPLKPQSAEVWQAAHGGYWVHHDRLVFAGTWNRTFTRLTTMESANESGRHAVNALLDHRLARDPAFSQRPPKRPKPDAQGHEDDLFPTTPLGDYCRIWDPERNELPDLMLLQRLDEANLARGLPHPWELLGVERLPSLLSHLPGAMEPFSKLFDVVEQLGRIAGPQASRGLLAVLQQIRVLLEAARPRGPRDPRGGYHHGKK